MRRTIITAAALLCLGGCSNLHTYLLSEPPTSANQSPKQGVASPASASSQAEVLRQAVHAAALPPAQQQVMCAEAQSRLQGKNPGQVRLALAAMGLAVPDCLPAAAVQRLLTGVPDSPLAAYLKVIADRQAADRKTLQQSSAKITSLEAKLKALTSIEQQLNQVKDRELQNQSQGTTAPR